MKKNIKYTLLSIVCISVLCSCNSKNKPTVITDSAQAHQSVTQADSSEGASSVTTKSGNNQSGVSKADNTTLQQQTAAPATLIKVSPDDPQAVKETAKELFDIAQAAADKYSTAGASLTSDVYKSTDKDSIDAGKINFCNMITKDFNKDGIWALKLNKFEVVSVVYSPEENCGVIVRYPDEYKGDVSDITADNIDSFL